MPALPTWLQFGHMRPQKYEIHEVAIAKNIKFANILLLLDHIFAHTSLARTIQWHICMYTKRDDKHIKNVVRLICGPHFDVTMKKDATQHSIFLLLNIRTCCCKLNSQLGAGLCGLSHYKIQV